MNPICLRLVCGLLLTAHLVIAREIPIVPPAQAGLSAAKLAAITPFMERQVADQKIAGGVIIVEHHGQIGFFQAYGRQSLDAPTPMATNTLFRIYSMSKAITTAGALRLVDAGQIKLSDPITRYLPALTNQQVATPQGLRPPTRPITIEDLLLHDSGLTYGDGPAALKEAYNRVKPLEAANLAEMVDRLSQVPLAFDPGTDWGYGVNIDVLGRIIEVVSGEPLDVYLQKHFFTPLDMPDTFFQVPPEKAHRLAGIYTRTNGALKELATPAEGRYLQKVTLFSGGGGLVSTAHDYLRFLTMIRNGGELDGQRYLAAKTVRQMSRNRLPTTAYPIHFGQELRYGTGFGLGFAVVSQVTDWDPQAHRGEFGWDGAASTHYWISPKDDLIVITLEQIKPYEWDTERVVKSLIYEAIER
ncbi:MAG TPA: serine hydrolase domain-containing protein [Verrucomicrobiae bacterium]